MNSGWGSGDALTSLGNAAQNIVYDSHQCIASEGRDRTRRFLKLKDIPQTSSTPVLPPLAKVRFRTRLWPQPHPHSRARTCRIHGIQLQGPPRVSEGLAGDHWGVELECSRRQRCGRTVGHRVRRVDVLSQVGVGADDGVRAWCRLDFL